MAGTKGSGRYKAGSGANPRREPLPEPKSDAADLLKLRYYTVPAKELTETDCMEASREVSRLLALGQIDHRVAETFDKSIRTTLQGIRQKFSAQELRELEEMERRAEERERKASEREAKARQRR